ncbi:hypothetical protein C4K04_1959 [Pseudomonas chlororaphis]|uniref:Uncharacterized protein n=1 Tax=Pseudomonas chlororaphis TaxID=587753 RepID=A0A3G7TKL7_9PSED|nr:hypothetical protein C4K04_1959 [Pseudomonas chlororaphis]
MRLANQALARATIPRTKERCKLRNVAKRTDRRRSEACPRKVATRSTLLSRTSLAPTVQGFRLRDS